MGGISSTRQTIFESYAPEFDSVTGISFGSAVLTNILNVSGIGMLSSIGFSIGSGSVAGVTANLEIQIDGGTTKLLSILAAGTVMAAKNFDMGIGQVVRAYLIPINTRFAVSCRVGINVTVAAGTELYSACVVRAMKI